MAFPIFRVDQIRTVELDKPLEVPPQILYTYADLLPKHLGEEFTPPRRVKAFGRPVHVKSCLLRGPIPYVLGFNIELKDLPLGLSGGFPATIAEYGPKFDSDAMIERMLFS
jgi:hypothetical protein